jgi:hypothetical protein
VFDVIDDQLTVTWSALPDHDTLELAISAVPGIVHRKDLSASYVTATGTKSTTLDTNIPGYDPAWKIDLDAPYKRKFTATRTQDATESISTLDEDINKPDDVARAAP